MAIEDDGGGDGYHWVESGNRWVIWVGYCGVMVVARVTEEVAVINTVVEEDGGLMGLRWPEV